MPIVPDEATRQFAHDSDWGKTSVEGLLRDVPLKCRDDEFVGTLYERSSLSRRDSHEEDITS